MMQNLDMDELTLLEMFEGGTREECLKSLKEAAVDFDSDPEMKDLLISLIDKVGEMTDKEYRELDYTEAITDSEDDAGSDIIDEYDEYSVYFDDDGSFIEGVRALHSPVDFIFGDQKGGDHI